MPWVRSLIQRVEILKANAMIRQIDSQVALAAQQQLNLVAELAIIQANALKVPAEIAQITAQTGLIGQQKLNLIAEGLNIPKQGQMVDAQIIKLAKDSLLTDAQILLLTQQKLNAVIEGDVLTANKCKLQAEFDLLILSKDKTVQETALLTWKTNTEKGQTIQLGVDADSVLGKQKALYAAQTAGFQRDAEQKAAKIMVDTWNVRRTTDEATIAGGTNRLGDADVGNAVGKMLAGVGV